MHRPPSLAVTAALAYLGIAAPLGADETTPGPAYKQHVEWLAFDIAEDATRFVFDETRTHPDGSPAYGSSFITQGYLYPAGTVGGSNGVLPDGSPEFPELVLGEWTCRGTFVSDGAHTVTGPWVVTTQLFSFGDAAGRVTLVTEGYEIADVGERVKRAVTGGTGRLRQASGQSAQQLLGFNATEGVNLRFGALIESD
jgi:hypothetical protein